MPYYPISIIDSSGVERFLGNIPAPIRYGWPIYGDAPNTPLIARSQWPALIAALEPGLEHSCVQYVHDQDGVGQCCPDGATALLEYCRAQQGLPFIQLSAPDLYDRINEGDTDSGSLLEDALRELMVNGVGTAATSGTIWRRGLPRASREERARFRVLEAFLCPTFDHVMSAALMGFGLLSGVMWYDNFSSVDAEGWLANRGTGSSGGHAVFGFKPAMRQVGASIQYGIVHQNSWREQWGIRGRGIFPETMYPRGGAVGGWYAVRLVTTEEQDLPAPRMMSAMLSFAREGLPRREEEEEEMTQQHAA